MSPIGAFQPINASIARGWRRGWTCGGAIDELDPGGTAASATCIEVPVGE